VVAEKALGQRIPFGFLANLEKKFFDEFDPEATDFASVPSYGCASFNGAMRRLMEEQGGTESGQRDALRTAQREIEGVREIMTENIERVLERGERIDLLVDKTDRLGTTARDFRVRSRGLRRRMWWKNVKLMVLLVLVVVFLLYLFVGFGCGLPGMSPLSCSMVSGQQLLNVHSLGTMPSTLGSFLFCSPTRVSMVGASIFISDSGSTRRRWRGTLQFAMHQTTLTPNQCLHYSCRDIIHDVL